MNKTEAWRHIHVEREQLAETLATLSDQQWSAPSWCSLWSVRQVVGHVLSVAEQTIPHFYRDLAAVKFKFNDFAQRDATRLGALKPSELINRLRARTTTTNRPPAPIVAILGEIVVHGEDIRRPLGITHQSSPEVLVAVADYFKKSNVLVGSKSRISGVHLRATDVEWTHGNGPLVSGPLSSLLLAMMGRKGALADLSGDGVALLSERC